MFAAIFTLALITVHVAAEVPSYIHVCGRKDPNIDECILHNVENIKDKICEGIPELDIESNNPFRLDKIVIFDTPAAHIYFIDANVLGLCNFVVNSFHIDMNTLKFNVDLSFKKLQINGTYDVNIHILSTNFAQKAPIYITTENVGAKVDADISIVTKSGKRYVYLSKMTINLDIKGYDIAFDPTQSEQLQQLSQIVRNFVGNNQKEILNFIKPSLEKEITKRIMSTSNDIVKHFTYEELFLDRT
ncbi:uncharacterized protein LOC105203827 [Solenopsis invicta]|uniref:uncharacterized protein LOC105203827 n=1 Tax=Solenopsis invicta TaxID=13686 RepID=UPI00193D4186|nr:uncharacterized protein LOC105203827 [Solenopsis invicta]